MVDQSPDVDEIAEARFPPDAMSARQARHWVREVLGPRRDQLPQDVVDLVVTELVSNAVIHAHSPVVLRIRLHDECVLVEVEDESLEPPREMYFAPEATAGRGVHIVQQLARRVGVDHEAARKRVWAEVPLEPPPI